MAKARILILDDETDWVARHKYWLEESGFECIYTQSADEAVEIALADTSIKVALIDEILMTNGQKQDLQGQDVRDEIRNQRRDVQFIVVTYLPQLKAKEEPDTDQALHVFSKASKSLERESQVAAVFHKRHLENKKEQDNEYKCLIQEIKQILEPQPSTTKKAVQVVLPSLWVVLSVIGEFFEGLDDRKRKKPREFFNEFSSESVLEPSQLNSLVKTFWNQVRDIEKGSQPSSRSSVKPTQQTFQILSKAIYFKTPGVNQLKELRLREPRRKNRPLIKPTTRSFQILEFLAWKVERGEAKSISEDEYRKFICDEPIQVSNSNKGLGAAISKYGNEFDEDGRRTRAGIGTEGKSEGILRLKVEIQRLENKIAKPEFGFQSHKRLFECELGTSTYTPEFDVGILFERADF